MGTKTGDGAVAAQACERPSVQVGEGIAGIATAIPEHPCTVRRERLLARLYSERDTVRCIRGCAGSGRTTLAAVYACEFAGADRTVWIDASRAAFLRAVEQGIDTLVDPSAVAQGSGPCTDDGAGSVRGLVVIDDVPYLDEERATRLTSSLEALASLDWEVIVIATPMHDPFAASKARRSLISTADLLLLDSEARRAPAPPGGWREDAVQSNARRLVAPAVLGEQAALDCFSSFLSEGLPSAVMRAGTAMMLMGKGSLASLAAAGVNPAHDEFELIAAEYPLFGADVLSGGFEACHAAPRAVVELLGPYGGLAGLGFDAAAFAALACEAERSAGLKRAVALLEAGADQRAVARTLAHLLAHQLDAGGPDALSDGVLVEKGRRRGSGSTATVRLGFRALVFALEGDAGRASEALRLLSTISLEPDIDPDDAMTVLAPAAGAVALCTELGPLDEKAALDVDALCARGERTARNLVCAAAVAPMGPKEAHEALNAAIVLLGSLCRSVARRNGAFDPETFSTVLDLVDAAGEKATGLRARCVLHLAATLLVGAEARGVLPEVDSMRQRLLDQMRRVLLEQGARGARTLTYGFIERDLLDLGSAPDEGPEGLLAGVQPSPHPGSDGAVQADDPVAAEDRLRPEGACAAAPALEPADPQHGALWSAPALASLPAVLPAAREPGLGDVAAQAGALVAAPGAAGEVPRITVQLLGRLRVLVDGVEAGADFLRRRRSREVLALLVMRAGKELSRDEIVTAIWPDSAAMSASNSLYSAYSVLRRGLNELAGTEGSPYLVRTPRGFSVNPRNLGSDVEEFSRTARLLIAMPAVAPPHESATVATCTQARRRFDDRMAVYCRLDELYAGDVLDGVKLAPLTRRYADRIKSQAVSLLIEASREASQWGERDRALWFADRAVEVGGSREEAYQVLMRAQMELGNRTAAMATYFRCQRFLQQQLGLNPSADTARLYQQLLADDIRALRSEVRGMGAI